MLWPASARGPAGAMRLRLFSSILLRRTTPARRGRECHQKVQDGNRVGRVCQALRLQFGRMRPRLFIAILFVAAAARADFHELKDRPVNPALTVNLQHAADDILKQYPKLKAE